MKDYAYKIGENGLITVCAWHMPGNTVLLLYPELGSNVRLSHGICQDCLAEQKRELAAMRQNIGRLPSRK
jgi:hypothetical protein